MASLQVRKLYPIGIVFLVKKSGIYEQHNINLLGERGYLSPVSFRI
jgi:hypothetical protein